jgi:hypothetical protein
MVGGMVSNQVCGVAGELGGKGNVRVILDIFFRDFGSRR